MKKVLLLFTMVPTFFVCGCNQNQVYLGKFNLHTYKQQTYLDSGNHAAINVIEESQWGKVELDKPKPVTFTINNKNNALCKVYYSCNYKPDDPLIEQEHCVTTDEKEVSLVNLELGKTYYFKVVSGDRVFKQGSFDTMPGIIRNLDVEGLKNVRDLGGYETALGHFKPNMIFRTSELCNDKMDGLNDSYITNKGANTMINDLKIKTEIDLRMTTKYEEVPDAYKTESILKAKYGADVKLFQLDIDYHGADPDSPDTEDNRIDITLPRERGHIQTFFDILSNEENYPLCFHCHIGTDRTGMFAAAIHSLLGADLDHIYYDYMFSNFAYIGGPRDEPRVNKSFLDKANEASGDTLYEKSYNLLKDTVGVPEDKLISIRNILLEK